MQSKFFVRVIDVMVIGAIGYFAIYKPMTRPRPPEAVNEFAEAVDLAPLRSVAIHVDGRLKSFDSFARTIVRAIAGPKSVRIETKDGVEKQDPVYSYLDLMFDPMRYRDANLIYTKKQIRPQIAQVMQQMGDSQERIDQFTDTGMLSQLELSQGPVIDELTKLDADVMRTSKFVGMVSSAMNLTNPTTLANLMRVIPPPGGDAKAAWITGPQLWGFAAVTGSADAAHAHAISGIDEALGEQLAGTWSALAGAWRSRDAAGANAALSQLADQLRTVAPNMYPPVDKLELESWYFRWHAFTWNWMVYLLAAAPLLLYVLHRWRPALAVGIFLLCVAFTIHTAGLAIRWHISGRIPNSNMFEAILAATWFGVVGAFVLEFLVRKTAMRGLFFLGAGLCSMVAMMCQHFMPTTLTPDIDNVMPVLNDLWLYIHTNVIIFSYALIGMAAITALLYLRYRAGGGNADVSKAGGAGSLILEGASAKPQSSFLRENAMTAGMVLDASTMVLMELAFVLLWAGLVMGAIWADHSWGRPWGWDPKEVFALCTFVIFLLLVHVRLKVRDKGLWTAVLAVVGCGVMLFNWIVINFKITGLHSYA